jgi:ADP-heptose:LPS heptosyltransferase
LIASARGSRPIIGLSDAREGASGFYDHIVPVDAGAHAVDRYLELPRALGVDVSEVVFPMHAGEATPSLEGKPFVVIHPWSRGVGKSMGAHELQVLCDCLTTIQVVIVGVNREAPTIRGAHVLDLTNQTNLMQLLWLMRAAKMVISVDSGPMHMAAAVNDHTLAIHTWSDPRKVGPYNRECYVWKAGRIAHRSDFTAEECTSTHTFTEGHARRVADLALKVVMA